MTAKDPRLSAGSGSGQPAFGDGRLSQGPSGEVDSTEGLAAALPYGSGVTGNNIAVQLTTCANCAARPGDSAPIACAYVTKYHRKCSSLLATAEADVKDAKARLASLKAENGAAHLELMNLLDREEMQQDDWEAIFPEGVQLRHASLCTVFMQQIESGLHCNSIELRNELDGRKVVLAQYAPYGQLLLALEQNEVATRRLLSAAAPARVAKCKVEAIFTACAFAKAAADFVEAAQPAPVRKLLEAYAALMAVPGLAPGQIARAKRVRHLCLAIGTGLWCPAWYYKSSSGEILGSVCSCSLIDLLREGSLKETSAVWRISFWMPPLSLAAILDGKSQAAAATAKLLGERFVERSTNDFDVLLAERVDEALLKLQQQSQLQNRQGCNFTVINQSTVVVNGGLTRVDTGSKLAELVAMCLTPAPAFVLPANTCELTNANQSCPLALALPGPAAVLSRLRELSPGLAPANDSNQREVGSPVGNGCGSPSNRSDSALLGQPSPAAGTKPERQVAVTKERVKRVNRELAALQNELSEPLAQRRTRSGQLKGQAVQQEKTASRRRISASCQSGASGETGAGKRQRQQSDSTASGRKKLPTAPPALAVTEAPCAAPTPDRDVETSSLKRERKRQLSTQAAECGGVISDAGCARLVPFQQHTEHKSSAQKHALAAAKSTSFSLREAQTVKCRGNEIAHLLQALQCSKEAYMNVGEAGMQRADRYRQRAISKAIWTTEGIAWQQLKARTKVLKFGRSTVHAWGLFAPTALPAEDFLIEYVGELIRSEIEDERERAYRAEGLDSSYLFRIDKDVVIDATKRGGMARYINHSCDPNCYTKVILVEGRKHIVIFSKRGIQAGEELFYDYNFAFEAESEPIPCLCASQLCRGRLN